MPANALAVMPGGARALRVMARKKFQKLLRLMRYGREAHLMVRFFCPRCKEPVALKRGEGLIEVVGNPGVNEKTDDFVLLCSCTRWTVNK